MKYRLMNEMPSEGSADGMPADNSVAEPSSLLNAGVTETTGPAVERPEWLLDKYVTDERGLDESIAEQAKAYTELQKQFGGFTGAPEEYEFSLPEGIEGEIDTELEAYAQFTELAREANMSQETAQKLFNIFVGYQNQMNSQFQIDMNQQKEALGPKADERLGSLARWAGANLAPEDMPAFESLVMTADQVSVLEKVIAKTRNSAIPKTNEVESTVKGYTRYEFDQDVNSERFKTDADFRANVRKKAAGLFPGA